MKDRFHNPFDGSRKRSAPQPYTPKKFKEKYKKILTEYDDFGYTRLLDGKFKSFDEEEDYDFEQQLKEEE